MQLLEHVRKLHRVVKECIKGPPITKVLSNSDNLAKLSCFSRSQDLLGIKTHQMQMYASQWVWQSSFNLEQTALSMSATGTMIHHCSQCTEGSPLLHASLVNLYATYFKEREGYTLHHHFFSQQKFEIRRFAFPTMQVTMLPIQWQGSNRLWQPSHALLLTFLHILTILWDTFGVEVEIHCSSWVIGIKFGLYIGTTHKRYRNDALWKWHLTVLYSIYVPDNEFCSIILAPSYIIIHNKTRTLEVEEP